MTTQLNGINYTEMLLTDEELAVVKSMRDGAKVEVNYWLRSNPDEAIEKVNNFGDVDRIYDLKDTVSFASNDMKDIECLVYLWK